MMGDHLRDPRQLSDQRGNCPPSKISLGAGFDSVSISESCSETTSSESSEDSMKAHSGRTSLGEGGCSSSVSAQLAAVTMPSIAGVAESAAPSTGCAASRAASWDELLCGMSSVSTTAPWELCAGCPGWSNRVPGSGSLGPVAASSRPPG
ncbi:hypothetical protein Q7C36_002888 [Tachysurus vachellii]|uniref:Uncharacterized protein n=1 Tax=Tachysurus vachellii TaxID=175792 RepID=A0AA88P2P7_TACVA|nr:hypothetical protein Q7C36_002888 [Tachysurus vachellii]